MIIQRSSVNWCFENGSLYKSFWIQVQNTTLTNFWLTYCARMPQMNTLTGKTHNVCRHTKKREVQCQPVQQHHWALTKKRVVQCQPVQQHHWALTKKRVVQCQPVQQHHWALSSALCFYTWVGSLAAVVCVRSLPTTPTPRLSNNRTVTNSQHN